MQSKIIQAETPIRSCVSFWGPRAKIVTDLHPTYLSCGNTALNSLGVFRVPSLNRLAAFLLDSGYASLDVQAIGRQSRLGVFRVGVN